MKKLGWIINCVGVFICAFAFCIVESENPVLVLAALAVGVVTTMIGARMRGGFKEEEDIITYYSSPADYARNNRLGEENNEKEI